MSVQRAAVLFSPKAFTSLPCTSLVPSSQSCSITSPELSKFPTPNPSVGTALFVSRERLFPLQKCLLITPVWTLQESKAVDVPQATINTVEFVEKWFEELTLKFHTFQTWMKSIQVYELQDKKISYWICQQTGSWCCLEISEEHLGL